MKRFSILSVIIISSLLTIVSCKSKKAAPAKGISSKASASIKSELGKNPPIVFSMNIPAWRKSTLWSFMEGQIKKSLTKEDFLKNLDINKIDKVLFLSNDDIAGKASDKKKVDAYVAITGLDAKKLIEDIANSKTAKIKPKKAKLNGQDALVVTEDGVDTYLFAPSKNVFVTVAGTWAKKITPGKGTLGKGDIDGMVGSEAFLFNVNNVDKIKSAKGSIDLSSGFNFNGEFNIGAKLADKAIKEFEKGKKQAAQMPMPGIKELIDSVKLSKKGSDTLQVVIKLSDKQLKMVMNMAKQFGGAALGGF